MELMFRFVYVNNRGITTVKCFYTHNWSDALSEYHEWAAETHMTGELLFVEEGTPDFDDNRFG